MINPQSVQTLILGIQDNLTTLANSLGSLGDSFELKMACGYYDPLIDSSGNVWCPLGFTGNSNSRSLSNSLRDNYPQYPHIWSYAVSDNWEFTFPVPNGMYQLRYWHIVPYNLGHDYVISIELNNVDIEIAFNVTQYCGDVELPRSKVYPVFSVSNNQPVRLNITTPDSLTLITAFELYKIGELP